MYGTWNSDGVMPLSSVGSGICLETRVVFPAMAKYHPDSSEVYDWENGIYLHDIEPDGEWMNALSSKDRERVSLFIRLGECPNRVIHEDFPSEVYMQDW